MAEKYIKLHGKLISVTEEVYQAYYQMSRQARTQVEKDQRRQTVSYDALDSDSGLGIDLFADSDSLSVEDAAIAKILSEKLHRCLARLPEGERILLEKIYYGEMTEREAAQSLGIPYMTAHNRKIRALRKLKKMMAK